MLQTDHAPLQTVDGFPLGFEFCPGFLPLRFEFCPGFFPLCFEFRLGLFPLCFELCLGLFPLQPHLFPQGFELCLVLYPLGFELCLGFLAQGLHISAQVVIVIQVKTGQCDTDAYDRNQFVRHVVLSLVALIDSPGRDLKSVSPVLDYISDWWKCQGFWGE